MAAETRDGRTILSQWLLRPITSGSPTIQTTDTDIMPTTSDVIVSYVTFLCAGAIQFTLKCIVDGLTLQVTFTTNPATTYYLYVTTTSDTLQVSSTITPFGQVQALYARSFEYTGSSPSGPVAASGTVRWQSL